MDQRRMGLLLIHAILRRRMLYRRLLWENDQQKLELEHQRMLFSIRFKNIQIMMEHLKNEIANQQKENQDQFKTTVLLQNEPAAPKPSNAIPPEQPPPNGEQQQVNAKWLEMQYWNETKWRTHFQLSTEKFKDLCNVLRDLLPLRKEHDKLIPVEMQVAIFLYKLASGLRYKHIERMFDISEIMAHEIFTTVTKILYNNIIYKMIYMPSPDEAEEISASIEQSSGLPKVIGCVGGIFIPITPPKNAAKKFLNKKLVHSLNLQIVVDDRLKVRYFSCLYPGSTGNGKAFENSSLFKQYKSEVPQHREPMLGKKVPYIIVGSGSYPLNPWLIKRYSGTNLCYEMTQFNAHVNIVRNKFLNAKKRIMNRWKILSRQTEIDYKLMPTVAGVCCVMHNLMQGADLCSVQPSESDELVFDSSSFTGKGLRDHLCVYLAINKRDEEENEAAVE